jgi:hypothetical protein
LQSLEFVDVSGLVFRLAKALDFTLPELKLSFSHSMVFASCEFVLGYPLAGHLVARKPQPPGTPAPALSGLPRCPLTLFLSHGIARTTGISVPANIWSVNSVFSLF